MGLINKRSILARLKDHKFLAILCLLLVSGCNSMKSCVAMEFMQGTVADGVARLSVQHISMITSELEERFKGPSAEVFVTKYSGHDEYGRGEVLWVLKDQLIDHPQERIVYKNCLGEIFTWQGQAQIVNASMHMKGRLTNNPHQPIIPDEGAITIKVHAKARNLAIKLRGREGYLRIDQGDLKFTAIPRLAQSRAGETKGLLAAPTSYMRFTNVHLSNISGTLVSDQLVLPVTIENSDLYVQVGLGANGEENVLSGSFTMFNNERQIPTDNKGLDPDYDREKFLKTFNCSPELLGEPLSFEYTSIEEVLSAPIAGLSSLVMGAVAKKLEEDTVCGMSSKEVLLNTKIKAVAGTFGDSESEVSNCDIEFKDFLTDKDCLGIAYELTGKVRVKSAKKTIAGLIATDTKTYKAAITLYQEALKKDDKAKKPEAVIPSYKQPVVFEIDADILGISLREMKSGKHSKERFDSFKIQSGSIKTKLKPVLAKQLDQTDQRYGFCAIQVPVSEVGLTLSIETSLAALGQEIHLPLDGDVDLVNGHIGSRENELRGEVRVGPKLVSFTKNGTPAKLNITYDAKSFYHSFGSCQKIDLPKSDLDCSAELGLSAHVARALIPVAGVLLKELAPTTDSMGDKLSAFRNAKIVPADKEQSLRFSSKMKNFFGLNKDATEVVMTLTNSRDNYLVNINEKMLSAVGTIKGEVSIEQIGVDLPASDLKKFQSRVGMLSPDKTVVRVNKAQVKDLDIAIDGSPLITVKSAQIDGIVAMPFMGEHKEGKYFVVKTPIVRIDSFDIGNAQLLLTAEGRKIPLKIDSAHLEAFNGMFNGEGNYIKGYINFIIGQEIFKVEIEKQELVPPFKDGGFKQEKFDDSYRNTENLKDVLPAQAL